MQAARAVAPTEEAVGSLWAKAYEEGMGSSDQAVRAVKDYPGAVRLFLTSLADGDFDSYFQRIGLAGKALARTRRQYEDLILSFHLFEEVSLPCLREHFGGESDEALVALDQLYHNVIAILARAYFQELELEREKFINVLAHDVRNMVAVIMASADVLLEHSKSEKLSPEKSDQFVRQIHGSSVKIANLVAGLLDYGRLKSGAALRLARFNLVSVVADAVRLFLGVAPLPVVVSVNGRPALEAGDLPPIPMTGDPALVTRAVGNYLSNAVKYARATVGVSVEDLGNEVQVVVRDDGPGVLQGEAERIFEDFYTAPGAKSGTGLGLASVRMIAEAHSGRAWAESPPGGGAAFYLVLPKAPEPASSGRAQGQ